MKLNLFRDSVSQMQNNSFLWQFNVWHKTIFDILNHSSNHCFDFLIREISTAKLETIEVYKKKLSSENFMQY